MVLLNASIHVPESDKKEDEDIDENDFFAVVKKKTSK